MGITVRACARRSGPFAALHDIDLEARPGEFLALLGPSDRARPRCCGSSPASSSRTAGRIAFDGEDVTDWAVSQRGVGFVFQQYALFRHMTVADNVAFGLTVRPAASARRARRSPRAWPSCSTCPARHARPPLPRPAVGRSAAAGGARARARGRAALPAARRAVRALDAKVRKDLRRWLRNLHDRLGLTSIFVTHDQEEALELATASW
jgi:sulfate transport system ATP-binding protein